MEPIAEIDFNEIIFYEKFTFEEETERPDELRFFTLEDQLQDYMNQRMPKKMPSAYELKKLENEVDRFKMLYLKHIKLEQSKHSLKTLVEKRNPSWIFPLFADFEYNIFDLSRWNSLFSAQAIREKNFYRDMIQALPHPYVTATTEESIPINQNTIGYVEDQQVRALGKFRQTRGTRNEDGTYELTEIIAPNSIDDNIRRRGFMYNRPFNLQQSLGDNNFLSAESKGSFDTILSLEEEYPSIESILNYGIPRTQDPYSTETKRYMKLWDLQLHEIPYSSWRSHFHPADPVPPLDITTIKHIEAPTTLNPPIHVIPFSKLLFDMQQPNLAPLTIEQLERQLPRSTPQECLHIDSYERFRESGVFRKKGDICVPPEIIHKERKEALVKGRMTWSDTTRDEIENKIRQTASIISGAVKEDVKLPVYEKLIQQPSELRNEVLLIYNDDHRTDEDKLNDIGNKLLKDILPLNHAYYDSENAFVFCDHSLAVLKGELREDANTFQRKWTALDGGRYICKYCGENIGVQFVNATEYDNDGYAINQSRPLDEPKYIKIREHTNVRTLPEMQYLFDLKTNIIHSVLYFILSALDIAPTDENQLKKILITCGRSNQAAQVRLKNDEQRIFCAAGIAIAGAVILIQTNLLTPKRRFKGKQLVMTGFPRDSENPEHKEIVNSIFYVLEYTLSKLSDTLTGDMRKIANKFNSKRTFCESILMANLKSFGTKHFVDDVKSARERMKTEDQEVVAVVFPIVNIQKREYLISESLPKIQTIYKCTSTRPKLILESPDPAILTAPKAEPYATITQPHLKPVEEKEGIIPVVVDVNMDTIRRRIGLKFPAGIKIEKLKRYVDNSNDGYGMLALLNRIIGYTPELIKVGDKYLDEIASMSLMNVRDERLIADIARGLFYAFLHDVAKQNNLVLLSQHLVTCVKNDMVARGFMEDIQQAVKVEQLLRAQERLTLVQRNRMIESDEERALMKQLLDLGLINGIITNKDRQMFADDIRQRQLDEELGEEDANLRLGNVAGDGENRVDPNGREVLNEAGDYGMHQQEQYEDNDRNTNANLAVLAE